MRALHDLLGGAKHRADVASPPRVGQREDRGLGAAGRHLLDVAQRDRCRRPPRSRACRSRSRARRGRRRPSRSSARHASASALAPCARELLGDPLRQLPLRHLVRQHLAGLRDRLRERGVGLDLLGDEREHGRRRGCREIRGDLLHVGRLPAAPASSTITSRPSPTKSPSELHDAIDVGAGRLARVQMLGRVVADPVTQPAHRARRSSAGRCRAAGRPASARSPRRQA